MPAEIEFYTVRLHRLVGAGCGDHSGDSATQVVLVPSDQSQTFQVLTELCLFINDY